MMRLRPLVRTAGVVAFSALTGCVTTTETETVTGRTPDVPPPVVTMPSVTSLSSMISGPPAAVPVTEMATVWMNRVAYLPDPTRNGKLGAGLAGQLILLGPNMQFAPANGTLTVDVYDETPRTPGVGPAALRAERWQFSADDLAKLVAHDERFGKSYTIFLPWVAFRSDVTRVKIMARYDPADGGHPLYAPASPLTLDNSPQAGSTSWSGGTSTVVPQVDSGPPPAAGVVAPPAIGPGR